MGASAALVVPHSEWSVPQRYIGGITNDHHRWPRSRLITQFEQPPMNVLTMNAEWHMQWHRLAHNSTPLEVLVGVAEMLLPFGSFPDLTFSATVPSIGNFHYVRRNGEHCKGNINAWHFKEISDAQREAFHLLFGGQDPVSIFHEIVQFWSPAHIYTAYSGKAKRNGQLVDL